MDFSQNIRAIRRKSLLSQADFAKELVISFSTVNRWETRKAVLKLSKLKSIGYFCAKHNIPFDIEEFI